jgi:hypothetical protein
VIATVVSHNNKYMERLSEAMSGLNMAQKRSFFDAFMVEAAEEKGSSKKTTRIDLARAKNRMETAYQNMLKTKERAKAIHEKLREQESSYDATVEDVRRLKERLRDG